MRLLNTSLMASPYNWVIVTVMLGFGLLFLSLVSPEDN